MCAHGISRSPKTLTSVLNVKEMVAVGLKGLCIRSEVRLTVGSHYDRKKYSVRFGVKQSLVGIFFLGEVT